LLWLAGWTVLPGWSCERLVFGCGRVDADGGHAEVDGTVFADHGDGVADAGAVGGGQLGDVAFDPVDEPPDSGDLLLAGGGVGEDPFIDAVDAGGEAFAGAQQVIEVGGQVGQVGDVGAEVVAAGAPLTELTAMFQQFRAGFRRWR
jgi:hypothetical protein